MNPLPRHPRRTIIDHVVGTLRDEDGRRVATPRSDRRRKVTRRWERRREYLVGMRDATPRWVRAGFVVPLVSLIASIGSMLLLALIGGMDQQFPDWLLVALALWLGLSLVGVILGGLLAMLVEDRLASRVLLGMGVCLRCWYDLRGTPKRDDGAVVCSECGCAWRIDRRLPPARPSPSA